MQGSADLAARQHGCTPGADGEPVNSGVLALDGQLDFGGQDQGNRPGAVRLPLPPFPVVLRPLGLRPPLAGAGVVLGVDLELV